MTTAGKTRGSRTAVLERRALMSYVISWRYKTEARVFTEVIKEVNARLALATFVEAHTNDEASIVFLKITEVE
jgi:hypothetical protein